MKIWALFLLSAAFAFSAAHAGDCDGAYAALLQDGRLKTVAMAPGVFEEDLRAGAPYIRDPKALARHLVHAHEGKLYTAEGKVLDTQGRKALYVMDRHGNVYVGDIDWHSAYLAGGDAAGAGECIVTEGKIEFLDNSSGHYRPPEELLDQTVVRLGHMGVSVDPQAVHYYEAGPSKVPYFPPSSDGLLVMDLAPEHLDSAIAAVRKQFAHDQDGPAFKDIPEDFKYLATTAYTDQDVHNRYWVLVDRSGKVVGGSGTYVVDGDPATAWLNWFFVDPAYRGGGYGRKLIEVAIENARKAGEKHFKVYTSDRPKSFDATILYKKVGMHEIKRKPEAHDGKPTGYNLIYLSMDL